MAGLDRKDAAVSEDKSLGGDAAFTDTEDFQKGYQRGGLRPRWKKRWWQIGGQDVVFVPVRNNEIRASVDYGADHSEIPDGSVFTDARATDIYAPIERYEGAHRFDPKATWTEAEEAALVRRVRAYRSVSKRSLRERLANLI